MHSQPPKSPNSSNPPSPPYQGGMKGKHQGGSPSQAPILAILAHGRSCRGTLETSRRSELFSLIQYSRDLEIAPTELLLCPK